MYDAIIYEGDDPVATITLNRPEAMNAWTNRMDREIRDAVARASADPAVVGIIITGAGRAFCAGADMKLLSNISSGDESSNDAGSAVAEGEAAADSNGDFDGRFPFLMTTPKPIIAAINGAVAGMAFPFSLCCDLRVGSEKSLFLTAFAQRGLIAEWGLGWLLPKLVGPSVALDLLMSSRRVTGVEAKEELYDRLIDAIDRIAISLQFGINIFCHECAVGVSLGCELFGNRFRIRHGCRRIALRIFFLPVDLRVGCIEWEFICFGFLSEAHVLVRDSFCGRLTLPHPIIDFMITEYIRCR